MATNSVTIQPPGLQRFTLQPCISKPAQNILRQKKFASNLPQDDQLALHPPKLAKDHSVKILSASTTLAVPPTPFDVYPEVFPAENNIKLSPLRPEINHTINLRDHTLVV